MGVTVEISNNARMKISFKGVVKIELNPTNTSIDMIELCININPVRFKKEVDIFLKTFEYNLELEYWDSFRWNNYRHNWLWKTEDYSIFLAYKSNNGNNDTVNKFKIKYNPNKVPPDDKFLKVMLNIFKYAENPIITWFDVAFDYEGVETSDMIMDKGKKREYKIFKYLNSDYTYYIGKSGTNGSIKIYDKASEETKGLADYNKTRYEVTIRDNVALKDIEGWQCKADIPIMYLRSIKGLYDDRQLSPTDKILIYAIEEGYPMEKLTYEQRKKYDKIMVIRKSSYTKIQPSQRAVEKAIMQFVNNLLN